MNRVQRSNALAKLLRAAAIEVEAIQPLGKIDWSKLFALLVEMLPLIITLFAKPDEEKPAV